MSNHIRPADGNNASTWRPSMVTLIGGRQVPSDSEEWRHECFCRERDARSLVRLASKNARRESLEKIRGSRGEEAAKRIEVRVRELWAAEKSKAKSCAPG